MRSAPQKKDTLLICSAVLLLVGIGIMVASLFTGSYGFGLFGVFIFVLAYIVGNIVTGNKANVAALALCVPMTALIIHKPIWGVAFLATFLLGLLIYALVKHPLATLLGFLIGRNL